MGSVSGFVEEHDRHNAQLDLLQGLLEDRLAASRRELAAGPGAGRVERIRAEIAEIESALERLVRGVYGTCRRCGAFIPLARLMRRPEVQHCAACLQPQEPPA